MTTALNEAARVMNDYGARSIPFLFIIDFEMERPIVCPLAEIDFSEIRFSVRGRGNARRVVPPGITRPTMDKWPMPFDEYRSAYQLVVDHQRRGDSYLANLTFPTPVRCSLTLEEIFQQSAAPYRLWFCDQFVVFSPETFVTITGGAIAAHPMKGTIRAEIPDAAARLLADEKELAEHITIVDLMRNDLSMVACGVKVEDFRYLESITTHDGELLQMSSRITGQLPEDYTARIGEIVTTLLPAGSVSGAPKRSTLAIIRAAEGGRRGYYTGVFGVFDGSNLDSAVMIRYLERHGDGLRYRSGGGITVYSDPLAEYQELIDKIYVPIA